MSRTDRLYALVEELRAVSPRPRSARWLAARFEVSARTIERDLSALQQSGVPVYAEPGRTGGYVLDRAHTLPPLAMTPVEAAALAAGLHTLAGTPMADAARSALAKVVAVMPARDRAAAEEVAARIRFFEPREENHGRAAVPLVLQRALAARRVLRIDYADSRGNTSSRVVEPFGFLGGEHWYLVAWCRLRDATRGFRLDRISMADELDETVPSRSIDIDALDVLGRTLVGLNVTANTDTTVSRGG